MSYVKTLHIKIFALFFSVRNARGQKWRVLFIVAATRDG